MGGVSRNHTWEYSTISITCEHAQYFPCFRFHFHFPFPFSISVVSMKSTLCSGDAASHHKLLPRRLCGCVWEVSRGQREATPKHTHYTDTPVFRYMYAHVHAHTYPIHTHPHTHIHTPTQNSLDVGSEQWPFRCGPGPSRTWCPCGLH